MFMHNSQEAWESKLLPSVYTNKCLAACIEGQNGTGEWYVDSALSSTLSITRLATVTDTGEPMAVPNVC